MYYINMDIVYFKINYRNGFKILTRMEIKNN